MARTPSKGTLGYVGFRSHGLGFREVAAVVAVVAVEAVVTVEAVVAE